MPQGFCEVEDVGAALQDDFAGANPSPAEVEAAIAAQTDWVERKTNTHWYDSAASDSDLVPTSPRSVANIRLDVPSSPHATDRQIHHADRGVRYPVTRAGPYCKLRLPHYGVETLDALRVRDFGGDVTDWAADPAFSAGRGEDYYLETATDERAQSHLFIRASSIGARTDFTDLVTLDYRYGVDAAEQSWDTVRRATALRAAAELVIDDEFEAAVPNDVGLVNVQTKADQYEQRAENLLQPFMSAPIA